MYGKTQNLTPNFEVMSETYCTAQEGDMEVIWVTLSNGMSVSVAFSSRKPDELVVRGWDDPEDGAASKTVLKKKGVDHG